MRSGEETISQPDTILQCHIINDLVEWCVWKVCHIKKLVFYDLTRNVEKQTGCELHSKLLYFHQVFIGFQQSDEGGFLYNEIINLFSWTKIKIAIRYGDCRLTIGLRFFSNFFQNCVNKAIIEYYTPRPRAIARLIRLTSLKRLTRL